MAKTAQIRARVEPELKKKAEQILSTLGVSPTEAIRIQLSSMSRRKSMGLRDMDGVLFDEVPCSIFQTRFSDQVHLCSEEILQIRS